MFTTSSFINKLHKKTFTRQDFINSAVEAGAEKILVGNRFFPERAMYWTRMFRHDAEKAGLKLEGIICDSEMITDNSDTLEAAKSDLLEWIRIAALSKIPALHVHIDGVENVDESRIDYLAKSLESVVSSAEQYGIMIVFSAGTASINHQQLINLAKKLGYTACRVAASGDNILSNAAWYAESDRG